MEGGETPVIGQAELGTWRCVTKDGVWSTEQSQWDVDWKFGDPNGRAQDTRGAFCSSSLSTEGWIPR